MAALCKFGIELMKKFIESYSGDKKSKISFIWNGEKDYDKWGDNNFDFRRDVIDLILGNTVTAPDILVRDLFAIEAEFAREAQGAGDILADLGDLLLNQTGSKYVEDYFIGKGQSFDTENTVIPYGVSKEQLELIVSDIQAELDSGSTVENLEYYIGYFEDYIEEKSKNA
jgi:hypothetical protein